MIIRPVDDSGDILPVLSSADLLRGAQAVALLVQERLELLVGDWWENPARGNEVLQMMQESRLAEADQQALANYLSSYIRQTPGVLDVRDVVSVAEGSQFSFSCTVDTEYGDATIQYETLSNCPNL